jgi:acetaldehyde dehydrogenase/alcohol dehydrogenase
MLQNIIKPSTAFSGKGKTLAKVCNKSIINDKIQRLNEAQEIFKTFDQGKIDYIFKYVAQEATKQRVPLAKLAHEETRMGVFEDKVIKNSVAAELPLSKYANTKTCDIIERDTTKGLIKVATPVGPIASLIPTTNPTSTAIIKSLFALKTRNAMIFLPHPRANKSTAEAVRICHDAAVKAGAPIDILQSVEPTRENSEYVMKHAGIKHILATGGGQMVKAAYQSGVPALGVGAGNAAVVIDDTANFDSAVGSIILGKTFDNGVICASEQSIVILDSVYDRVIDMFKKRGVYFVEGEDKTKLGNYLIVEGHVNADIVGQSAKKIAKDIDISVPDNTVVLAAEVSKIGEIEPFSHEKLSPILGFYRASDFEEACNIAESIVKYGGAGHTAAIYSKNQERIDKFALKMPAFHLMANMPTSLGAIGSAYNYNVDPSFTLGVGSIAGSSLSGNLKPEDLLDIKTLAEGQVHIDWFKVPPSIYFNRNCTDEALDDLSRYGDLKRVIIVTDKMMVEMGYIKRIITKLESNGFTCSVFDGVMPDPNIETVRKGVELCKTFKPDTLICIGGGSPLDAGKMIRVFYENPKVSLEDLSARFVESRKRTNKFPEHGSLIKKVVCIPTTSGTGSETTAFSVITDDDGNKHPICSYRLTPDIAIIDSSFTDKLPKSLIAYAGLDSLTHSIESYVSCVANDFTSPMSLKSLKMVYDNLEKSYNVGDPESRDKVHKGASMAGLAFTNAFLGITHAISHKVAAKYHLAHGLTNAIILPHVIKYNSSMSPTRQAYYPQYTHPIAKSKYVEIAKELGISGTTDDEYVENLIEAFIKLSKNINTPTSFSELGIDEDDYLKNIDEIAFNSFDDQCVLGNPRFPMVDELKIIIKDAYYGYKK